MLIAYTQGSICHIAYPQVRFLPLFDFRRIVVRFFSCLAPSLEVDLEHERERLCFLLQLSPIWRQELYRHLYILPKPPPKTFQSQTVPLFAKFSCLIYSIKNTVDSLGSCQNSHFELDLQACYYAYQLNIKSVYWILFSRLLI